jgi:hypothetical protein
MFCFVVVHRKEFRDLPIVRMYMVVPAFEQMMFQEVLYSVVVVSS